MSTNFNNDQELLKKLSVYTENYSKEELETFENTIFTGKVSKKKRAELEIARLRTELARLKEENPSAVEEYLQLGKLIGVAEFDPSVLDEIFKRIVKLELQNGISIRLYTALPLLQEEQKQMQLLKGSNAPDRMVR